jgi:methylmalonyl-CoA/ethylmalonyl-CoA epimerase
MDDSSLTRLSRFLGIAAGGALLIVGATARAGFLETASPPAQSAQLGGKRLQQVALTTRDLPRAKSFYQSVLGLPLMFESNGMAFFDVGGTRLMIALNPERPAGGGTSIIYFDAPDFDATVARLKQLGVNLVGSVDTVQRTKAGHLKLQQFKDPDGNMLGVMGMARVE